MTKLKIDGQEIEVPNGSTVFQACTQAGIEVPHFCFHEKLKIAGNCRMCLVEVKPGPPKPQASCALPVAENMEVFTDTPMVKKAREGVMEFLLINHPLDCPICDQGGECDLQDQAYKYGDGESRYREYKRAVEDKYMGPLIKTQMTRCIHCTRCIRFMEDVAGVPELGAVGRGEHMEVTTYVEKSLDSELAGNIVDLCPVGALTSRPYAFIARPWELKKVESVDVHDALGSNIRVDVRHNAVMRVLPVINEDINEEWLADKSRHACDGLRYQRLDKPYIRKGGKLTAVSWDEALTAVAEKLTKTKPDAIAAIAGDLAPVEAVVALKDLMDAIGSPNRDCRQDGAQLPYENRADYLFNTTIAGVEQADICLLIGSDVRNEAPLLNARLRKAYLDKGLKVYGIGEEKPMTYPVEWLSDNPSLLNDILAGKGDVSKALKEAKNPMLILGQGALSRPDGEQVHAAAKAIAQTHGLIKDGWNGFNVLHMAAGRVGALDAGFVPAVGGYDMQGIVHGISQREISLVYLLGADEFDMAFLADAFVIYQGHHGDAGAQRADIILPGAAYTEQPGIFVNTEGRAQLAMQAVYPPGEAKEDWKILRALSGKINRALPYDSLDQLRKRIAGLGAAFTAIGDLLPATWQAPKKTSGFEFENESFFYPLRNYYMTDPISRHSRTMAECTVSRQQQANQKAAA
jgi:NADH-quinone oxidoreductase subunit G